MDYTVRRVQPGDWSGYRELRLESLANAPEAFLARFEDEAAQPPEFWHDRVARSAAGNRGCIYLATPAGPAPEPDRFTGTAGCFVEPEVTDYVSAHVVAMYVTPAHRGRGVADALLAATVRWAQQEAQADRIRLYVVAGNDRALAVYRRAGFVPSGATIPYPPDPTRLEHELVYQGAGG